MSDLPAPNWFADPHGTPGLERYWDGAQWTDHTRPAGGEQPAAQPVAQPVAQQQPIQPAGTAASTIAGIRTDLLDDTYAEVGTDRVTLQNSKLLKVVLGDDILARQGSMVAFQGQMDFDYEGSGSLGKFLKKAATGEGVSLMRVTGQGDLFLADDAKDVHIIHLEGGGLSVNGKNILAFEPTLQWDVNRIQGAGILGGGLFNTTLQGQGWVAVVTDGPPVVLRTDAPTYTDTDAVVAWSSNLQTTVNKTIKAKALVGRGSGEAVQLAFAGQGIVIVQPSEGGSVPPHTH